MDLGNFQVNFRYIKNDEGKTCSTECTILDMKDNIIGTGQAKVYYKDAFNKKTGRKLSLRRAIEDATLNKAQRTKIFNEYFAVGKRI